MTAARKGRSSVVGTERVLSVLKEWIASHGMPPTYRELAHRLGLRSTNSVRYHLRRLEAMRLVRRLPGRSRGFLLIEEPQPRHRRGNRERIPLLGRVAAGEPILAEEIREGWLPLDPQWQGMDVDFALRVRGESMEGVGILDSDLVLVKRAQDPRDGDIVVAMLDGEATVKRFARRGSRILLEPAHPDHDPILVGSDIRVLGIVVGLFRRIGAGRRPAG